MANLSRKAKYLISVAISVLLLVSGVLLGDFTFIKQTDTYGNFDIAGTQSWVMKLRPGLAKDYASAIMYGKFNRAPLVAIGSLFLFVLLLSIVRLKKDLIWRKLSQWSFFVITRLGVFRVAGICPINRTQLGVLPILNCQACEMSTGGCPIGMIQWSLINKRFPAYSLGIVLLFAALLGRVVCGWLCTFGLISDLLDRYMYIKGVRNKFRPIFAMNFVKYFVIIFIGSAFIWTVPYFCIFICQSANIYGLVPYWLTSGLEGFKQAFSAGTWLHTILVFHLSSIAVMLVFAILFGGRWFCKFVCPLGAVYGLFNYISPIQVVHIDSKCTNCKRCIKECPMNVDLKRNKFIDVTSCIRCGKCTKICSARKFKIGFKSDTGE